MQSHSQFSVDKMDTTLVSKNTSFSYESSLVEQILNLKNAKILENHEIDNSNHIHPTELERDTPHVEHAEETVNIIKENCFEAYAISDVKAECRDNKPSAVTEFQRASSDSLGTGDQTSTLPEDACEMEESNVIVNKSILDDVEDISSECDTLINSTGDMDTSLIPEYVAPQQGLSDSQPFLSASALSPVASFEDEKSVAIATEMASAHAPPDMPLQLAPTILINATQPIVSIPNLNSLKQSPSKNKAQPHLNITDDFNESFSSKQEEVKSEIDLRIQAKYDKINNGSQKLESKEKVEKESSNSATNNQSANDVGAVTHLTQGTKCNIYKKNFVP